MALIKCLECNNDVSTQSKRCPKCGAKMPMSKNKKIFWGVMIFIIIIILGNIDDARDKNNKNNSQSQENTTKETQERIWITKGKEAVINKLKDGSSAEFRNVFFNNNGTPVSCGEVNSKNSFGAYSGYQRFIYVGSALTILEEEVNDGIQELWNQYCVKPNLALQKNLMNTPNEGTSIIINSEIAKYFVLEKNMKVNNNKNLRSIVTKRVGSSGVSYSKRLYDCKNNTVKYLGTGDSIDAMNKSKEDVNMSSVVAGSIAYEVGLIICSDNK